MTKFRPFFLLLLAGSLVISGLGRCETLDVVYNSAADIPIQTNAYTASGNLVNFTLNFAPATGTELMLVQNNGLDFIQGTFDNLVQGQTVELNYGGARYTFVANYYGGTGNDLVLDWATRRPFGWGTNSAGQLGNNTTNNSIQPATVLSPSAFAGKNVVALASGLYHSLALCSDGTVFAWGDNSGGQLGTGRYSPTNSLLPVPVSTISNMSALYGKRVAAIAAGGQYSLALCSDGKVVGWGRNDQGPTGSGPAFPFIVWFPLFVTNTPSSAIYGKVVVAIAAGGRHSLALCSDGTVAAWGYNYEGELGAGYTSDYSAIPVAVYATSNNSALYGKSVVAITAGTSHSLALCSDGTAVGWGANLDGQLGTNFPINFWNPVAVTRTQLSALNGKTVVALAAGDKHSLALCSDGTLAAWGKNGSGQLGDNIGSDRAIPVSVNTTSGVSFLYGKTVTAIAAGYRHSLALCSDGTIASWGGNLSGQLGNNTTINRLAPGPVSTNPLAAAQRFTGVASGPWANNTLALVAAPPADTVTLEQPKKLSNGTFQFAFTNVPGGLFGVLAATNLAPSATNWVPIGDAIEVASGQFQFDDLQSKTNRQRFYRVHSP